MNKRDEKFILKYIKENQKLIEKSLRKYLPKINSHSSILLKAIHYSIFSGGKRIRPILTIATGEMLGEKKENLLPSACAIEFIHTQSLIHDDLPCMDNDDFRRGKPTLHRIFGEANALLSGDALILLAFKTIVERQFKLIKDGENSKLKKLIAILRELSNLSGLKGLISGQVMDLQKKELFTKNSDKYKILKKIYIYKTSSLFEAAVRIPAILCNANSSQINSLTKYARYLGLAFQVKDDLLETKEEINSVSVLGREKSEYLLKLWTEKSLNSLKIFKEKNNILKLLAEYLLERRN
jgi:geranylgeranyl diphosphate synthase type II